MLDKTAHSSPTTSVSQSGVGLRPGPPRPPLHFRLSILPLLPVPPPPHTPGFPPFLLGHAPLFTQTPTPAPEGKAGGHSRHFAAAPLPNVRPPVNRSTAGKRSPSPPHPHQAPGQQAVSHDGSPVRRGSPPLAGPASSGFIEPHQ
ncbi:hypothetical protein NL676_025726 [Syzygium grande]|nr:hypothetical protein NL676_025726 [Syzygium grande]